MTVPSPEENAKIGERLARIKNRLLVFSGKGGVRKSTVAANLAQALAARGLRVGALDVDIHGPNLAKMLGVEGRRLEVTAEGIRPVRVNPGLSLISMSFLTEGPDNPVIWRGPMKMKVIQQFLEDVEWGDLDWLIIDSPPGTGDEPLSVAQLIPATGAVVVTTPQDVSILDSRKAVIFAQRLGLKVLGIVENMSGFVCPHCGGRVDLFKTGGGERAAAEMGIPFLGRIPFDPGIVTSGDAGRPFAGGGSEDSAASRAFAAIVDKILSGGIS
ncbi:MAG: Mrp/NBP35 family ATP-binding protein [Candidatus Aminicenantes bacterium]|nr:Mrp/NBP35 family ATP-binding protein [Candidatus Aminicenantes bacterium]